MVNVTILFLLSQCLCCWKVRYLFVISYVNHLGPTFGQGTSWEQTGWKSKGTSNLQWKESAGAHLGRNCDPCSSSFTLHWCSIFGSASVCSHDWSIDHEGKYTHTCYTKKKWNVFSIGQNDNDNNLSSIVKMIKEHLHVLFHSSLLTEYLISPLISWYRILFYQQCPRITISSAWRL